MQLDAYLVLTVVHCKYDSSRDYAPMGNSKDAPKRTGMHPSHSLVEEGPEQNVLKLGTAFIPVSIAGMLINEKARQAGYINPNVDLLSLQLV